jgi:hypothetical protein
MIFTSRVAFAVYINNIGGLHSSHPFGGAAHVLGSRNLMAATYLG